MSMFGGTVVIEETPVRDYTPQDHPIRSPKPYQAPDGLVWVSEGAYQQNLQLRAARERIKDLERELADLGFPVAGISAEYHATGRALWVWPTQQRVSYPRLLFKKGQCYFCLEDTRIIAVDDDENGGALQICQDCAGKVFNAFEAHEQGEAE